MRANRKMGGFYMTTAMYNWVRQEARRRGSSMQEVIRKAVFTFFYKNFDSSQKEMYIKTVIFSKTKQHIRRKDLDKVKPKRYRIVG